MKHIIHSNIIRLWKPRIFSLITGTISARNNYIKVSSLLPIRIFLMAPIIEIKFTVSYSIFLKVPYQRLLCVWYTKQWIGLDRWFCAGLERKVMLAAKRLIQQGKYQESFKEQFWDCCFSYMSTTSLNTLHQKLESLPITSLPNYMQNRKCYPIAERSRQTLRKERYMANAIQPCQRWNFARHQKERGN